MLIATSLISLDRKGLDMKTTRLLVVAIMLETVLSMSVAAQANPQGEMPKPTAPVAASTGATCAGIALIDTQVFSDEKVGITRYVQAMKALELEFMGRVHGYGDLYWHIAELTKEIAKLKEGDAAINKQVIQSKQEDLDRFQRDLNNLRKEDDALFTKRYSEVVSPTAADINAALDRYAVQHGIMLILDKSKLNSTILISNPAVDITQAFITEYNREHPVTSGTILR